MAKKKPAPKGSVKMRAATDRNMQIYNEAIATNATFSRSSLSRQLDNGDDPRRSIDDDCGFPKPGKTTPEQYRDMYRYMPIARRVVEVLPAETWQRQPLIQETDDLEQTTPFEEAWEALPRQLSGASWHKTGDNGGNVIWEYLQRLDAQSGVGDYGVLLLGVNDGLDLSEELSFMKSDAKATEPKLELLFMRVFDQVNARINRYVTDDTDPRFGQPEAYDLTFDNLEGRDSRGQSTRTETVHWTRCIHVADNRTTSEIIGTPRQQPVYNNLLSLRKMYGGSAEMYWRGAFPGLSIETQPELGGDVVFDADATKDEVEAYMNSLQRVIHTVGMHVNSLAPQVVDPSPQIRVQLEAIAILLGIPLRVFMGSERGELASGQDDETWNDRLRFRQATQVTPRIIVPFVDRLIQIGVLPTPESYTTVWPDLDSPTALSQAEIAELISKAIAVYVESGSAALIPPLEFFVHVLKLDKKVVEAFIDEAFDIEALMGDDDDTEGQTSGGEAT